VDERGQRLFLLFCLFLLNFFIFPFLALETLSFLLAGIFHAIMESGMSEEEEKEEEEEELEEEEEEAVVGS